MIFRKNIARFTCRQVQAIMEHRNMVVILKSFKCNINCGLPNNNKIFFVSQQFLHGNLERDRNRLMGPRPEQHLEASRSYRAKERFVLTEFCTATDKEEYS